METPGLPWGDNPVDSAPKRPGPALTGPTTKYQRVYSGRLGYCKQQTELEGVIVSWTGGADGRGTAGRPCKSLRAAGGVAALLKPEFNLNLS